MALNAKLKKAVELGLITQAQAELLAKPSRAQKPTRSANLPGFLSRVSQIIGGILAISGLSVFTYWANITFAPWGYVLLMLGYVSLSLWGFLWLREKQQPLATAVTGFIFTCVVCGFLISFFTAAGWLNPQSPEPQWLMAHTITLATLLSAAFIASRFNHWLTDLNLALSLAGAVAVTIGHFTPHQGYFSDTANGLAWVLGGLCITVFTFAWRHQVTTSLARSTTPSHIIAALYLYIGLATLEPGINIVPQSLPFLTLYLLLIVFGAFIQRRAYIFAGTIGILGFVADYLWAWLANPLLFSFIAIGLGLFMVYGTASAQMWLSDRWVKKLPLPAALAKN